ncbi:pyridoxamine 5'-phosphate oxidase [Roseiconus lacunae]|uniref:pyridoxamine 5'-phosphate oxidase n=1 Tax=Roseiconus lacunae TaxID=2605694 RepID=UPI00308D75BF|nr:pyridoxamine 5'-phosphate oxidase [Stieleria sp. HD01]
MSLYEMRKSYTLSTLLEKDIDPNPMVQFKTWLSEALQGDLPDWVEVNAMTLSTSDGKGEVSSRIVLLKGLEQDRFWFYTNYDSDKAAQMESNSHVALCFLWQHIQRQVRVTGTVSKAPRDQSEAYFRKRPRDSQLGAIVSSQSSVVESREVLERRLAELKQQHGDSNPIPCPDNWGGYCVDPITIEFWQGRDSRLHDRLRYRKDALNWRVERLAP